MTQLEWTPLTEEDLPALLQLAEDCLGEDGGLPDLTDESMLRTFFLSDQSIGGRDETGDLVAAGGIFPDGMSRTATGLVHPGLRGQGVGAELVRWCREAAPGPLKARIENVSAATESLLAEAGMRRTFAETVMRHSLRQVPVIARPAGLTRLAFDDDTAPLFHEAYRRSFGDRPGFPDTPLDAWAADLASDPAFRPQDSRVVLDEAGEPVGFVTVSDEWIDQVGVAPAWRGRRLGAHLVVRSLAALRDAGAEQVWLSVNVNNDARDLYERLGFRATGTRARYADR